MINKTAEDKLACKPWAVYVVDVTDGKFDIKGSDSALIPARQLRDKLAAAGGNIRVFAHFGLDLTDRKD